MQVYIFQADIYCEDCAADIRNLLATGKRESDIEKEDSEHWPQGPYPNGGGEADCPQHCGACNLFLENPLTDDGYNYASEAIADQVFGEGHRGTVLILREWAKFYSGENDKLDKVIEEWREFMPQDFEESSHDAI